MASQWFMTITFEIRWTRRPVMMHLGEVGGVVLPFHGLIQASALGGRGLEDLPLPVFEARQPQSVGHLGGGHGLLHVLLVGKHHQDGLLQFLLLRNTCHYVVNTYTHTRARYRFCSVKTSAFGHGLMWLRMVWRWPPSLTVSKCCSEQVHLQHGHQLQLGDAHSVPVAAVHHVDDRVCVGVVAPPVGPKGN